MKKAKPSSKPAAATKPAATKPTTAATKKPAPAKPAVQKPTAKKPAAAKATPVKVTAAAGDFTEAERLGIPADGTLAEKIAAGKKIEAQDRPSGRPAEAEALGATSSAPQRISGFPNTFISEISVRLEDPDHPVTLTWSGPDAAAQETGPFRSSPGAGVKGLNCNNETTSRRSGSNCTPKGTFTVTGFASRLNSHPEATDVTWIVPARAIAFHYYPTVPKFAASHGCVRIEKRRVAQLIKNNSRAGVTKVIIDGTWTKPAKQF